MAKRTLKNIFCGLGETCASELTQFPANITLWQFQPTLSLMKMFWNENNFTYLFHICLFKKIVRERPSWKKSCYDFGKTLP